MYTVAPSYGAAVAELAYSAMSAVTSPSWASGMALAPVHLTRHHNQGLCRWQIAAAKWITSLPAVITETLDCIAMNDTGSNTQTGSPSMTLSAVAWGPDLRGVDVSSLAQRRTA